MSMPSLSVGPLNQALRHKVAVKPVTCLNSFSTTCTQRCSISFKPSFLFLISSKLPSHSFPLLFFLFIYTPSQPSYILSFHGNHSSSFCSRLPRLSLSNSQSRPRHRSSPHKWEKLAQPSFRAELPLLLSWYVVSKTAFSSGKTNVVQQGKRSRHLLLPPAVR